MANIKSQIKRILHQQEVAGPQQAVKSEVKTAFARPAPPSPPATRLPQPQRSTVAVEEARQGCFSKGVIHKNQAANKKSAIAKQVSAL